MMLGQTMKLDKDFGPVLDSTLDLRRRSLSHGPAKDLVRPSSAKRSVSRQSAERPASGERRKQAPQPPKQLQPHRPDFPRRLSQDGPTLLEWTHAPMTTVQEDGGVRCQVSMPGMSGNRLHKPYLKQTLRIEPIGQGKPPPLPQRNCEQIVVKESDLKKFGNDLQSLRQVQVLQPSVSGSCSEDSSAASKEFELSFKSAFAKRCRTDAILRDPWKDMKNPEFSREQNEQDLVLNQVWINAIPKRRAPKDDLLSPRQSDAGSPARPKLSPEDDRAWTAEGPADAERTLGRRRRRRGASESLRQPLKQSRRRNRGRTASEGPPESPASRDSQHEPTPSRIQPIESVLGLQEDLLEGNAGSLAVRAAVREQRNCMRELTGQLHYDLNPRSAWIGLCRKSGEAAFYPKEAAERLEAAYRSGRASVPLAGLGSELDTAIVTFARSDDSHSKNLETSLGGSTKEVQRIAVPGSMAEVKFHIKREDAGWSFASDKQLTASPNTTADLSSHEEKRMYLTGAEVVTPPEKLPPVNRNQRTYFINAAAEQYWT